MYDKINQKIKKYAARLVVVSKTRSLEAIKKIYDLGQRDFGENRVQELMDKKDDLPEDIRWHLIGHLQTNKVKYIAPFAYMIHSVDSKKIWKEINKEAEKNERSIKILLQIKIAKEDSKYGFDSEELYELLDKTPPHMFPHTEVCGVMGMATFTDNMDQVRDEFRRLKKHFETIKENHFKDKSSFQEISMGMSGDYEVALEEGSTMLRVGSIIFE